MPMQWNIVLLLPFFQEIHLANVFGFSLYVPLCPYPGYSTLQLTTFGFILPLVGIITIFGYIMR